MSANVDFDTYIDANLILMFVTNKGSFGYDNDSYFGKGAGLYYPYTGVDAIADGSFDNCAIFAGSIWAGAIDVDTKDTLITTGQHDTDWGPGPIIDGQAPPNPISNTTYKVYKLYVDSLKDNPNQDYLDYLAYAVDQGAPATVDDEDGEVIPDMIGDQMCWSVYNDLGTVFHTGNMGTDGLGLEIRQTAFAFDRVGALANVVFMRFRIFNKGGRDLEHVMISLWSDPDLGEASDDLVGCDTALSLGFCYNEGSDADYGSAPPATGYDFFQGPLIYTGDDNDVAKMWDTTWVGYMNMGMTSFNKYINGTDPDTPLRTWSYMNGLDASVDPIVPMIDPITGDMTMFYGTGDPVSGTGFLDANSDDRRWMQTTGPFDLSAGDSTEIMAAIICGQGGSPLSSITELKAVDAFAQKVYDSNFVLPAPPAKPDVEVTELDGEIILTWGTASEDDPGDYPFEGYALMQGPSPSGPWTDTLGWYDIRNDIGVILDYKFNSLAGQNMPYIAKPGTNEGLQHYYGTTRDVTGGGNLVNNRMYHYVMEAYSFDTTKPNQERTLTSQRYIPVSPHMSPTGTDLFAERGDTIVVEHTLGNSPGSARVFVVDPSELTGHDYEITFSKDDELGNVWHVIDVSVTPEDTVVNNWVNQSDLLGENHYPMADGLLFKVAGPPPSLEEFQVVANRAGVIDPPEAGAFPWPGFPVPTEVDPDGYPTDGQQVGDGLWGFHTADNGGTNGGGTRGGYDAFLARATRDGGNLGVIGGYDYEMRFTGDNASPGVNGGYAIEAYLDDNVFWVPFELWNIGIGTPDDASDDVRLVPLIIDDGDDNTYNLESYGDTATGAGDFEHSVSGGDNDPFTDWVYWYTPTDMTAGQAGYLANEAQMVAGTYDYSLLGDEILARTVLVSWNGGDAPPFTQDLPEQGTIFRIITAKPNTAADVFSFTTAGYEPSVAATGPESRLDDIRAVPNPYYLYSGYDTSPENRVLKFTNLPEKCTITIYNLAGDLVRTIEKTDATSTEATWDVENEFGVPVGSGIYIYVVDAPAWGQKIGKMAVFTEVEVLDQF
ncbi:MAG: hypothetical protein KAU35_00290 [candidate division Zixibacteria bacterium]|nr:hypothetical protein [candidate division Zixibacteria bacterium]